MPSARIDLPQGTLDLLILHTLALGAQHEWAIAERVQQVSSDVLRIQPGSLYPALHRLERRGWIKAHWGTSENNRRAKYYELTRAAINNSRSRKAPGRADGSRPGFGSSLGGGVPMFSDLRVRFRSLFRRTVVTQEIDQELRFHLDQQMEKYLRAGLTREEARRRVRLAFGGLSPN